MLDLTVRLVTWMLSICTPTPRGRHRAGAELLDGSASHPATLGIDIGPKHIQGICIPAVTR